MNRIAQSTIAAAPPAPAPLRLGVNIDHVATIRNARGGANPCPVAAAQIAVAAGADGITAHLREDRRHVRDDDIRRLRAELTVPLNFEMAATEEMVGMALAIRPHAVCLVPERRGEVTTEGGLDVAGMRDALRPVIARLADAGIRVSLFIDAEEDQIAAAREIGAPVVELHTGRYCDAPPSGRKAELARLAQGAAQASILGLECHAGHGLSYETVGAVAALPQIVELNIGHFLVGEAVFIGLGGAVRRMKAEMTLARNSMVARVSA